MFQQKVQSKIEALLNKYDFYKLQCFCYVLREYKRLYRIFRYIQKNQADFRFRYLIEYSTVIFHLHQLDLLYRHRLHLPPVEQGFLH